MAIQNATIQHRRGALKDFDAAKMLPGEFAVTTDGSRKVLAAFAAGDIKELASKEEVKQDIAEGIAAIEEKEQEALQNIGTGVDSSLKENGKAADAGATGKAIDELKEKLLHLQTLTINYYNELKSMISGGATPEDIIAVLDNAILDVARLG